MAKNPFLALALAFTLIITSNSFADKSPDITGDGIVNFYDLQQMANQWLNTGAADLDDSGKVDIKDYAILQQNWMQTFESSQQKYLRISEIMFNPQAGDLDNDEYEFVELINIDTQPLNISGAAFTFGIDLALNSETLAAGSYGLVVKNQSAFMARYGANFNFLGTYTGSLDNGGEGIILEDLNGQTILDFAYDDNWFDGTDGNGFSLVIADENANADLSDSDSWRISYALDGSPGANDVGGESFLSGSIIVNEVMAHSNNAAPDWIELYNTTDKPINIGGWFLSDSSSNVTKFEIAQSTVIQAFGYKVFTENVHFGNNSNPGANDTFALSENGEKVVLSSGRDGVVTGYSETQEFGASPANTSLGLYVNSENDSMFVLLDQPTQNQPNSGPKVGPVIISEIMYNSDIDSDAEYVEFRNISSSPVSMYNATTQLSWKFVDEGGIEYSFPASLVIAPGENIIVAKDRDIFLATYGDLLPAAFPQSSVYSWLATGGLSNKGEKVRLLDPGDLEEDILDKYIEVDVVDYGDSNPWPGKADGDGESLTRKSNQAFGNDPDSWSSEDPTPGRSGD